MLDHEFFCSCVFVDEQPVLRLHEKRGAFHRVVLAVPHLTVQLFGLPRRICDQFALKTRKLSRIYDSLHIMSEFQFKERLRAEPSEVGKITVNLVCEPIPG